LSLLINGLITRVFLVSYDISQMNVLDRVWPNETQQICPPKIKRLKP